MDRRAERLVPKGYSAQACGACRDITRTGYSPPALSSVTVVAETGAMADALTKVFFVAGPAQARVLAHRWKVDALWVDKAGNWEATPGLRIQQDS
ncbi:FAD:protein FMN transferase [Variovorax rhizosphaerae]|uniref:FAD:protein FMN transferase n=1 Tax=Variovorax rhizosphaerae TaxID=1836200 RepID=A0ABU8WKC8_9BURK